MATDKTRAHRIRQDQAKAGKMKPQSCVKCGEPKSEAHHEDYSKPLEVIWLCHLCHMRLHHERGDFRGATYKLTADDVIAIRASSLKNVELAKQFGVRHNTISNARSGKSWKHIPKGD